ncbi:MAG: diguanylate cyclase [Hahellaceae bacterium]|nr:diguanylate cyclase [Hahellaceae bacterium]
MAALQRILFFLLVISSCAHAVVDVSAPEIRLEATLQFVEDTSGNLDLDTVMARDIDWQSNGRTFNQGYHGSAWWLHVVLHNPQDTPLQRLLEVGYAALDYVDIFVVEEGVLLKKYALGDKYPYSARPIDHRFPLVPVNILAGQTLDIYLRVQSSGALQVPLTLWEYSRFHSADFDSTVMQGAYFGGLATMAVFNLLIFIVLRELSYLLYVGFIVSTMLAMAAQQGLAFRVLWPEATQWNDHAILFFTSCTGTFAILFTLRFLRVETFAPKLARVLQAVATCCVIMLLLCFVIEYRTLAIMTMATIILAVLLAVVSGVVGLIKRVPSAQIYLLAWTLLLIGAGVISLSRLGVVEANLFTEYAVQLGSLLEVTLLSLALASRINTERRLRYQAQSEALQASRVANAELEERVKARTLDLEQLNQRLQRLSETDQLTGLANRRFLEQRLKQEWERARRHAHPVALLLIDVDHFKQVNDHYGHPAGDACLQQVAQQISAGLRQASDVAARYGGEEFCLLLPHTDRTGAEAVAERIRQNVEKTLMDVEGVRIALTVSIGLNSCIPSDGNSMEQLIKQADEALYHSKQTGRNRVMVSGA